MNMATKTTKKSAKKIISKTRKPVISEMFIEEVVTPKSNTITVSKTKLLIAALAGVGLLLLFWYKTNTWPVVALVDNMPIFRWEVDQQLYAQAGSQVVESITVERLIASEIKAKKVVVSDSEVQERIDQIKTQVGSDEAFKQALEIQGLTEESLKNQFKLQLGLERLVEPSTDSAVLQERIYNYVEGLRNSGRVKMLDFSAK
jgi:hypothetical protein